MTAQASRTLLAGMFRPLVAALNAWSYGIARSRAERRRRAAQARQNAAQTTAAPAVPRWPTSWGD